MAATAACTSLRASAPRDASVLDGGRTDAVLLDAGPAVDAGRDDTGVPPADGGRVDAGPIDAGPRDPCPADARIVACWPLDGDGLDRGRRGIDLTPIGTPMFPMGGGVLLDGASRLQAPDNPGLDEEYLTIEAWVRLDVPPATGRVAVVDVDNRMLLAWEAGTGLVCATTAMAEIAGVVLPLGAWTHVVCSLGVGEITLWVDGVRLAADVAPASLPITSGAVAVGGGAPDGSAEWNGGIDDVRLYLEPLSGDEIVAHAAAGRSR